MYREWMLLPAIGMLFIVGILLVYVLITGK
jgi:hypothetical protein